MSGSVPWIVGAAADVGAAAVVMVNPPGLVLSHQSMTVRWAAGQPEPGFAVVDGDDDYVVVVVAAAVVVE